MRRSKYRRASSKTNWLSGRRRWVAVGATVVVFGGIVTVTQVSNAATNRTQRKALAACENVAAPAAAKLSTKTRKGTWTEENGAVTQHADDGAGDTVSAATLRRRCRDWVMQNTGNAQAGNNAGNGQAGNASGAPAPAESGAAAGGQQQGNGQGQQQGNGQGQQQGNGQGQQQGNGQGNGGAAATPPPGAGLGVLANSCEGSRLTKHTGFQIGNACVSTEFGEVSSAANNSSLLIVQAPQRVNVGQAFTLQVSTRNLIRDRFLAAGQGGYYVESSVLQNGIVRGHFHTACRMLASTNEAPDPSPVPAFFLATEDRRGGRAPDTVTINVPGLPAAGTAQCASWAGDGSHRIPMMERANETPAFDAVKIQVGNAGGNAGANNAGNNNGGGRNRGN
jgi:hypothetical protein